MSIIVLRDIPVSFDLAALLQHAHVEAESEDAQTFAGLVELAGATARPKAIFAELFIDGKGEDTIEVGAVTFTSRMLKRNLEGIERIFPFVATCGVELDAVPLPDDEYLAEFWWDTIKEAALWCASHYLHEHLNRQFQLEKTSVMSPGSGDADVFPIAQQAPLFSLLDNVTPHIGVRLTDSFLMTPNKTISGIVFPSEVDFHSCQVCRRAVCPNRTAPFDEMLWLSVH